MLTYYRVIHIRSDGSECYLQGGSLFRHFSDASRVMTSHVMQGKRGRYETIILPEFKDNVPWNSTGKSSKLPL